MTDGARYDIPEDMTLGELAEYARTLCPDVYSTDHSFSFESGDSYWIYSRGYVGVAFGKTPEEAALSFLRQLAPHRKIDTEAKYATHHDPRR